MKRTERIKNNCIHCAHCIKHYGNLNGKYYIISGCIHCKNSNLTLQESSRRILDQVKCEYWQEEQIQIDERRKSIERLLYDAAKKLNDVAQILEEDNRKR